MYVVQDVPAGYTLEDMADTLNHEYSGIRANSYGSDGRDASIDLHDEFGTKVEVTGNKVTITYPGLEPEDDDSIAFMIVTVLNALGFDDFTFNTDFSEVGETADEGFDDEGFDDGFVESKKRTNKSAKLESIMKKVKAATRM